MVEPRTNGTGHYSTSTSEAVNVNERVLVPRNAVTYYYLYGTAVVPTYVRYAGMIPDAARSRGPVPTETVLTEYTVSNSDGPLSLLGRQPTTLRVAVLNMSNTEQFVFIETAVGI